MQSKTTLVILAAGMGSRYGSVKQIDRFGKSGETIADFSIYDAYLAGFRKIVFLVRKSILKEVQEVFYNRLKGKVEVEFICQEVEDIPQEFVQKDRIKPWGTAHAVLRAKDLVKENFCVINADDFYGREAFVKMKEILDLTDTNSNEFSMIGYSLENTMSDFGSVSRGECIIDHHQYLQKVTERTHITKKGKGIFYRNGTAEIELNPETIVSMNIWGFTPKIFQELEEQMYEFLKENHQHQTAEFYLPMVVNQLIETKKATVKVFKTNASWMGVTYKEDKPQVVAQIAELQNSGVYPQKLVL